MVRVRCSTVFIVAGYNAILPKYITKLQRLAGDKCVVENKKFISADSVVC